MYVDRSSLAAFSPADFIRRNEFDSIHHASHLRRGPLGAMLGLSGVNEDKALFSHKYQELRALIITANQRSDEPISQTDLNSSLASLDRVYARVMAGEWNKGADLINTARRILDVIGRTDVDSGYVEGLLRDVMALPARIGDALVAAARTAGTAAGTAAGAAAGAAAKELREAGVDPGSALEEGMTTVKWIAGAVIVGGLAWGLSNVLKLRRK